MARSETSTPAARARAAVARLERAYRHAQRAAGPLRDGLSAAFGYMPEDYEIEAWAAVEAVAERLERAKAALARLQQ